MPKGGLRKGAGRKARPTSKAKGIWCGQITNEQRDFIIHWLSPDERFGALWAAANKACSGRVDSSGSPELFPAEVIPSAKVTRQPPRR
jgi:hypothetical protein